MTAGVIVRKRVMPRACPQPQREVPWVYYQCCEAFCGLWVDLAGAPVAESAIRCQGIRHWDSGCLQLIVHWLLWVLARSASRRGPRSADVAGPQATNISGSTPGQHLVSLRCRASTARCTALLKGAPVRVCVFCHHRYVPLQNKIYRGEGSTPP